MLPKRGILLSDSLGLFADNAPIFRPTVTAAEEWATKDCSIILTLAFRLDISVLERVSLFRILLIQQYKPIRQLLNNIIENRYTLNPI